MLLEPFSVYADFGALLHCFEVCVDDLLLLLLKKHDLDGFFRLIKGSVADHGLVGIVEGFDILLDTDAFLATCIKRAWMMSPSEAPSSEFRRLLPPGQGTVNIRRCSSRNTRFFLIWETISGGISAIIDCKLGAGDLGPAGLGQDIRFQLCQFGVFQQPHAEARVLLLDACDLGVTVLAVPGTAAQHSMENTAKAARTCDAFRCLFQLHFIRFYFTPILVN